MKTNLIKTIPETIKSQLWNIFEYKIKEEATLVVYLLIY